MIIGQIQEERTAPILLAIVPWRAHVRFVMPVIPSSD